MGFDWKLVDFIVETLEIRKDAVVLDPFTGAGTTLVQCKKRGIDAIGLDVNPVCTFASRVKTTWGLETSNLEESLERIILLAKKLTGEAAPEALLYLKQSGMISRGWLSLHKAKRVLSIRSAIRAIGLPRAQIEFFELALVSALVGQIADIKFGPEVYVLPEPRRLPVVPSFRKAAKIMIEDMRLTTTPNAFGRCSVSLGDSRNVEALRSAAPSGVDFVVTSPPYPNEHDYTRSTRLELVLLDHVSSLIGLQTLKKQMVRCTTKGTYKDDDESKQSVQFTAVAQVATLLDSRAKDRTDGFSRLYGKMVREYFGGMTNHFRGVSKVLRMGGQCAYVVRDSQSLGVYIDTPQILAEIASSATSGLVVENILEWKRVRGTTGTKMLSEKIILLRKVKD